MHNFEMTKAILFKPNVSDRALTGASLVNWPPRSDSIYLEITCPLAFLQRLFKIFPSKIMEASIYVILLFNTEKMRNFRGQSEVGLPRYTRFSIWYGRMAKLPRVCHTFATWSKFAIHGPILIILVSKCISKVC